MDDWLFVDPKNVMVVTVHQIMDQAHPILFVSHDLEDGCWQFLTGGPPLMKDALLVTLLSVVTRDPTIKDLADLPLGWTARRNNKGEPWIREPKA